MSAHESRSAWIKPLEPNALREVPHMFGRYKRAIHPGVENLGMILGLAELAPGEDTGWDEHPEPEAFYVLDGEGTGVWIEDGVEFRTPLRTGHLFYKVGGIRHRVINGENGVLRGLYFKIKPC